VPLVAQGGGYCEALVGLMIMRRFFYYKNPAYVEEEIKSNTAAHIS